MEDAAQSDSSNVNPIALIFLAAMILVMATGRRQGAVKALLATAAFLPLGQQVVVAGLHFQFFRILILFGFMRVFSQGEFKDFNLNGVDRLLIAWGVTATICGALRDPGAIFGNHCLGFAFNAFGTYFLIRALTRGATEVLDHIRFLVVAATVIAMAMVWEFVTHHDLFAVFGGVPDVVELREGRFRCQGPFEHPILAGTFMATLFPVLTGLLFLKNQRDKRLAIVGIVACVFSSYAAASSGALLTCLTAIIGLVFLWPLRLHMRWFRRGSVVAVLASGFVMKAPFWYIIARISDHLGGTGWHRAYLIDQAVGHFGEWFLIGTGVTAHWAPSGQVLAADPLNMDITNNYIAVGIQGGLLGLGFFLAMIVACFKIVGRKIRSQDSPFPPRFIWAIGVSLACHCTAMISISYFDQIQVFWFWLLAVFATLSSLHRRKIVQRVPADTETVSPVVLPERSAEGLRFRYL
jgi:O-antigen ligase